MAPLEDEEAEELDAVGVWLGEARLLELCALVVVVGALVVVVWALVVGVVAGAAEALVVVVALWGW